MAKRGIQARGPVNLLRTLLTAAVETGALHTTQRYVHATAADLRDAIARLSGN